MENKQNQIAISIITVFILAIAAAIFFYYQNVNRLELEKKAEETPAAEESLGAELFEKTQNPAEKLPETNPFEAKTNPFSDYKNPFE